MNFRDAGISRSVNRFDIRSRTTMIKLTPKDSDKPSSSQHEDKESALFDASSRRNYQRQQKDIIEVLNGWLICTSLGGQITHINDTFLKHSGWTRDQWIGKLIHEL